VIPTVIFFILQHNNYIFTLSNFRQIHHS
jgi:hypothetical protein